MNIEQCFCFCAKVLLELELYIIMDTHYPCFEAHEAHFKTFLVSSVVSVEMMLSQGQIVAGLLYCHL